MKKTVHANHSFVATFTIDAGVHICQIEFNREFDSCTVCVINKKDIAPFRMILWENNWRFSDNVPEHMRAAEEKLSAEINLHSTANR